MKHTLPTLSSSTEILRLKNYIQCLVNSQKSCIEELALDGSILSVSCQGMRLMEIDDFNAYHGAHWIQLWHGDNKVAAKKAIEQAKKGKISNFVGYAPTAKGTYKWWDVTVAPLYDEHGTIYRLLSISTDISSWKAHEIKLQEAHVFADAILDSLPAYITVLDKTGIITHINKSIRVQGNDETNPLKVGVNFFDLVEEAGEEYGYVMDNIRGVLEGAHDMYTFEFPYKQAGRDEWYLLQVVPLKLERGGLIISFTDITERIRLEKQKEEFMHIASHELRTPLTSLKGYAHGVKTLLKHAGSVRPLEILQKMDGQLNRLNDLISDLFDITKIQAGKMNFKEELYIFEDIVRECVDDMRQTTTTHSITFKARTKTKIIGDKNRVAQVVINLVSNAIKYSPEATNVLVAVIKHTHEIICSVTDYGVGISPEHQAQVFDRFFRVRTQGAPSVQGLGLGLFICAEIVRRSGGRIWVESEQGKGSTFSFALPLS